MSQQTHDKWGGSGRSNSLRTSSCNRCGQLIHWIESIKGKNIPCDLEIRSYAPGTKIFAVKTNGAVWNVESATTAVEGWASHHSTCPRREGK